MKGSYPIEVAWISDKGKSYSSLIKPSEQWLEDECLWSKESEKIHHLDKSLLVNKGKSISKVINLITDNINYSEKIYSDNPSFDQDWLNRLFNEKKVKHNYVIHDFNKMLDNNFDPLDIQGAYYQAKHISPPTHRAQRDVEYLFKAYEILTLIG